MSFSTLLVGLAGPVARQVMLSLGIGVVTFTGVDLAVSSLLSVARESWAGAAGDIAAYLAMGGFNTGLSILAGAITGRVALIATKSFRLL